MIDNPRPQTIIDKLYKDNKELISYLRDKGEISFAADVEVNFSKMLLLSCASFFESELMNELTKFFDEGTRSKSIILIFLQNKAMIQQYHTYFDWKVKNANKFFSLFGEDFKKYLNDEVKNDEILDNAIKAFLEIGRERNALVHENFANYALIKTVEEIYELYKQAYYFVISFPQKLNDFTINQNQPKDDVATK